MKIKFEWNENGSRGGMVYEADVMIKDVPMTNYKKWAKLFAKYGTPEQHTAFLERIKAIHKEGFEIFNGLLAEQKQWEDGAKGLTFGGYTRDFCATKVKKVQSNIKGVKTKIETLAKKHAFLKGLLS